ncbi:AraC family transcriptional regulator [Paenibacillus sp. L3-i20]|uniref:helix-turn-helix transcriptional regulator n=1 Tax=Paenibacillus sp. L3-i20 TaxID=2905833 RepID=UPI001EDD5715|nr:helix-turn-helix domain-containing protein [Paenibacillus sp. L3-i20]GKU79207.1 hypothetical protein L3i20_v236040 [Paenibacillus sp. L3-i20]
MLSIKGLRLDHGMSWFEEHDDPSPNAWLVIVTYGKCIYWINGEKTILERGDFLLIQPGVHFYGKSVPTVFHEKFVIQLALNEEAIQTLSVLQKPIFVCSRVGCFELILERLRVVWKEWQESISYCSIRAISLVLDALSLWSREIDRGDEATITLQHTEKMKAYIQEFYRGKITKEQLGACIGRTPNHAAALFRRVTGQTISDYVHATRMRTATYLLKDSLLTITEISEYLGYSDVSYFQRVFKRSIGLSPTHYLKLQG